MLYQRRRDPVQRPFYFAERLQPLLVLQQQIEVGERRPLGRFLQLLKRGLALGHLGGLQQAVQALDIRRCELAHDLPEDPLVDHIADSIHHAVERRKARQLALLGPQPPDGDVD